MKFFLCIKNIMEKNNYVNRYLEEINNIIKRKIKKYSDEDILNFKLNPEKLEVIFEENNIDYKNIKYIIFSMPKTGSLTLFHSFSKKGLTLHFHSIIELLYRDIRFGAYDIKEIISFLEKYNDKIIVISSYRIPYKRAISFFYHNFRAGVKKKSDFDNVDCVFDLISNENMYIYNIYYKKILENEFNIHLQELNNYNKDLGYGIYNYSEKITFIFTCLSDFDKFFTNIPTFLNMEELEIINKNINDSSDYKNNKITFSEENIKLLENYESEIMKYYHL